LVQQKYNYNKGDYAVFRSSFDCDWDKEFAAVDFNTEAMWNILKPKLMRVFNDLFPRLPGFIVPSRKDH